MIVVFLSDEFPLTGPVEETQLQADVQGKILYIIGKSFTLTSIGK